MAEPSKSAMKFLYALLAASCTLAAQVVEGTVVNSATGAPAGGVTVALFEAGKLTAYQSITNLHGGFRIEGVKDGTYTANFASEDFLVPLSNSPARHPFQTGSGPTRLQVQLTPLVRVSGRVLDING